MPKKSGREGAMSAADYRALLERNNLRQEDARWICGVGIRQARAWAIDEYPVPQYAALLLKAYDQGLITAQWLAEHIAEPPPA